MQRPPPDIILLIATYSIIFPFTMWCRKVVPTCWSTMIFFIKEDVGEVKLVFERARWTIRPVVDLLFHGNSLIFDIINYKVVVQPYAILFVLQVMWYWHIVLKFLSTFFVMYSCTKQSQLFVAPMYCHDFILLFQCIIFTEAIRHDDFSFFQLILHTLELVQLCDFYVIVNCFLFCSFFCNLFV